MAWLTGYQYRKSIAVGAAAGSGTNYQVKVQVLSGNGSDSSTVIYLNGKATYYPNDVAFTASDGSTLLKSWLEYDTGYWWVKVADDISSTGTTIYVYYTLSSLPDPTGDATTAVWKRYSGNPVMTVGAGGKWDDFWVQFNSIIKVGSTYYGYYQGCNSDFEFEIGLATSTDGITWTKDATADGRVLTVGAANAWDDESVGYPMVWKEGSTWYMMFQGKKSSTGVSCIGLATSDDGIAWTKSESNPVYSSAAAWDNKTMQPGTVMLKEGNTYYFYYRGDTSETMSTGSAIGLATSTDLTTWTDSENNPILSTTGNNTWDACLLDPTVMKFGSTYYMWYEGATADGQVSRNGLATSAAKDSGWSRVSAIPILGLGSDTAWDNAWSEVAVLVNFGTEWRMYYGGSQNGTPRCKVGYSTYTITGNGNDVFLLFDDFNSYGVDAAKWTNTGAFAQNKADIYKYAANTNAVYVVPSANTFAYPLSIEAKAKVGADWSNEYGWFPMVLWDSAWATTGMLGGHYKDAGSDYWKLFMFGTHSGNQSTNGSISAATWYKLTLIVLAADQYFKVNGTQQGTTHLVPNQSASNVCLATNRPASGADYTSIYDWIFVRKMPTAVTEPAIGAIGSEEPVSFDTTLTVAGLTHADGLDVLSLSQVHNLSVLGLAHGNSIGAFAITQVHNLIVNALTHAGVIDSVALTQIHQLTIQALSHIYAIEVMNLLQAHNLAVDSLSNAHSLGNVDILLSFMLAIQDLIHSHSLEVLALSQNSILTIQEMLHSHLIGALILSQVKVVAPMDVREYQYQRLRSILKEQIDGGFDFQEIVVKKNLIPDDRIQDDAEFDEGLIFDTGILFDSDVLLTNLDLFKFTPSPVVIVEDLDSSSLDFSYNKM